MQKLRMVLHENNFVFAERHEPGEFPGHLTLIHTRGSAETSYQLTEIC